MANENQWCFAWMHQKPRDEATKAALVKAAKWKSGDIITVSFLDGVPSIQEKIKQVARTWVKPGMANLKLDFRNDNNTDIRISFRHRGSWSTIGTECRFVDKPDATMNYGWLDENSTDDELRRVVLHEFGHALGLVHEHQNPAGGIQWNRAAVIAELSGSPNNWSLEDIEHNMFEPQAASQTNFTDLDVDSIMMYPIPANWTTNGFSIGLNDDFSAADKNFIRQQYS
ncbi:MAG: M12 family metallopeptidase [Acidobacteriota bacterium]|nr:M12 family metallopeptidase [Acidobacteriota bacterium]